MKTGRNDRNQYTTHYPSPLGVIRLTADEEGLTGLWFETEEESEEASDLAEQDLPVLDEMKQWLDIYFAGREPDFFRLFILSERISSWRWGSFCAGFPMGKR